MRGLNKFSKVLGFKLADDLKGNIRSKSQKLFSEFGLIRFNNGMGTLSPLLVKSLRKLERLVRKEMEDISALEIILPSMTHSKLLEKSGRIDLPDLFKLKDTNEKSYILNPTCEEAITDLIASMNAVNYKQLPLRFYQISNKFRNEKRSKSGLIRSKEFLMKDLYCFDATLFESEKSYEEVKNKYHDFFQLLNVPYICVKGLPGTIGGLHSHEFHFLSDAGDDELSICQECGHHVNIDYCKTFEESCPNCHSKNINISKGIEVGHIFQLGTKYTEAFGATYTNKNGKQELIHMSCFGLGLSRILAASVEVLSVEDQIRWPISIAPYLLCIIPPKAGSNEEKAAETLTESIFYSFPEYLREDIIIDDRTTATIGKRFSLTQQLGFPFIIVIGRDICSEPPCVEVHNINENKMNLVQISNLNQFISDLQLNKAISGSLFEKKKLKCY